MEPLFGWDDFIFTLEGKNPRDSPVQPNIYFPEHRWEDDSIFDVEEEKQPNSCSPVPPLSSSPGSIEVLTAHTDYHWETDENINQLNCISPRVLNEDLSSSPGSIKELPAHTDNHWETNETVIQIDYIFPKVLNEYQDHKPTTQHITLWFTVIHIEGWQIQSGSVIYSNHTKTDLEMKEMLNNYHAGIMKTTQIQQIKPFTMGQGRHITLHFQLFPPRTEECLVSWPEKHDFRPCEMSIMDNQSKRNCSIILENISPTHVLKRKAHGRGDKYSECRFLFQTYDYLYSSETMRFYFQQNSKKRKRKVEIQNKELVDKAALLVPDSGITQSRTTQLENHSEISDMGYVNTWNTGPVDQAALLVPDLGITQRRTAQPETTPPIMETSTTTPPIMEPSMPTWQYPVLTPVIYVVNQFNQLIPYGPVAVSIVAISGTLYTVFMTPHPTKKKSLELNTLQFHFVVALMIHLLLLFMKFHVGIRAFWKVLERFSVMVFSLQANSIITPFPWAFTMVSLVLCCEVFYKKKIRWDVTKQIWLPSALFVDLSNLVVIPLFESLLGINIPISVKVVVVLFCVVGYDLKTKTRITDKNRNLALLDALLLFSFFYYVENLFASLMLDVTTALYHYHASGCEHRNYTFVCLASHLLFIRCICHIKEKWPWLYAVTVWWTNFWVGGSPDLKED